MKEKIFAIYCGNSTKEDVINLQTHLFDYGYQWYSSKHSGERKFKEKISEYILIEGDNIFEAPETILNGIFEYNVVRFNSPTEYLRHYKIKKITTKYK
jgi:hypothetical protein